jgi:hypothetical protein
MKARALALALALAAAALGQGWVGQGRVSGYGSSTYNVNPSVALADTGVLWVAWHGYHADTSLLFAVWEGGGWSAERGVLPDAPGVASTMRLSLASDDDGQAWLVWHNVLESSLRDVGSSHWLDTCWGPEIQVNEPDSIEPDYAPKVACGSGQVWCAWYGGLLSTYSVFASRWNDQEQRWEPEMRVSPDDGRSHWWCDVAVDAEGTPHVVWCTHPLYTVFHSYYEDSVWQGPFPVNDTTQVTASPWADPHVISDRDGVLHLSFTGASREATQRDIFYTSNDGSGWLPPVRVTQDTAQNYPEWYSDIAADRPDNVWVVWDRQGEGQDQFRVYASHYDGVLWSREERLDDDTAYYDGRPSVCLDRDGLPWVCWDGKSYGTEHWDIFYNRFGAVGLAEHEGRRAVHRQPTLLNCLLSDGQFRVEYDLPVAAHVSLRLYDLAGRQETALAEGHMSEGRHEIIRPLSIAGGVYCCRLETDGAAIVCKIVNVK